VSGLRLRLHRLATPFGGMLAAGDGVRLFALEFADRPERFHGPLRRRFRDPELVEAEDAGEAGRRLAAYFAGDLAALDAIAVEPGGTAFQRAVWQALRAIPPGRTLSYGALAGRLGRPAAARAVGHANGANPLSVVVPCHRLVGAGGGLTGYGGGLERKRLLLEHERAHAGSGG